MNEEMARCWGVDADAEKALIELVWPEWGYHHVRKHGKQEQKINGDHTLIDPYGATVKVEVKATPDPRQDFPLELIQDVFTCNLGWYFDYANVDELHYVRLDGDRLSDAYAWSWPGFKLFYRKTANLWYPYKSKRGFGFTIGQWVALYPNTKRTDSITTEPGLIICKMNYARDQNELLLDL